jgi:hypothetical protein
VAKKNNTTLSPLADEPAMSPLLTGREAAAILRCSVSSLNKWRVTGLGPRFVRVGSRVRYRRVDLAAYLAERVRNSTSATTSPPTAGVSRLVAKEQA